MIDTRTDLLLIIRTHQFLGYLLTLIAFEYNWWTPISLFFMNGLPRNGGLNRHSLFNCCKIKSVTMRVLPIWALLGVTLCLENLGEMNLCQCRTECERNPRCNSIFYSMVKEEFDFYHRVNCSLRTCPSPFTFDEIPKDHNFTCFSDDFTSSWASQMALDFNRIYLENVALDKPAVASSTGKCVAFYDKIRIWLTKNFDRTYLFFDLPWFLFYSNNHLEKYAFDASVGTLFHSEWDCKNGREWLMVDLQDNYAVSMIRIYSPRDPGYALRQLGNMKVRFCS